jgi:hypothetical protein
VDEIGPQGVRVLRERVMTDKEGTQPAALQGERNT